MDNDTNKKMCARCNKLDCAQCVEEDGKSFCCQVCCDEYKKERDEKSAEDGSASSGKEEPVNVCRFC